MSKQVANKPQVVVQEAIFSDLEILALSKAAGSDDKVKKVRANFGNDLSHHVDFKVHIKGDINIGCEGFRTNPCRTLTKVNFGKALSKLNEATVQTLLDAFSQVLVDGNKEDYDKADLKPYVRKGLDVLFCDTMGIQNGAVKFDGSILPIED